MNLTFCCKNSTKEHSLKFAKTPKYAFVVQKKLNSLFYSWRFNWAEVFKVVLLVIKLCHPYIPNYTDLIFSNFIHNNIDQQWTECRALMNSHSHHKLGDITGGTYYIFTYFNIFWRKIINRTSWVRSANHISFCGTL